LIELFDDDENNNNSNKVIEIKRNVVWNNYKE
jgi:hypothetical protein